MGKTTASEPRKTKMKTEFNRSKQRKQSGNPILRYLGYLLWKSASPNTKHTKMKIDRTSVLFPFRVFSVFRGSTPIFFCLQFFCLQSGFRSALFVPLRLKQEKRTTS